MGFEHHIPDIERYARPEKPSKRQKKERAQPMRQSRDTSPRFLRKPDGKRQQTPDVIRLVGEEEHPDLDVIYERLTRDFLLSFSQDVRGIRGVQTASTTFQNRLLRVLYQKVIGFNFRELQEHIIEAVTKTDNHDVRRALEQVPSELATYRKGVEETLKYIREREIAFARESQGKKELVIGTNDELDAQHKIDLVEAIIGMEDDATHEIRFVQIKTGRFDSTESGKVYDAHEEYVRSLHSSESQERRERMAKSNAEQVAFAEKIAQGPAAERFDMYGERYNDLLLQSLIFCTEEKQNVLSTEHVQSWIEQMLPSASEEDREARMAEFSLLLRSPKSRELFRVFAMAAGEERVEEMAQKFDKLIRGWALAYEPPLNALRAVTGEYQPHPKWIMLDTVRFKSVYKSQDQTVERGIIV